MKNLIKLKLKINNIQIINTIKKFNTNSDNLSYFAQHKSVTSNTHNIELQNKLLFPAFKRLCGNLENQKVLDIGCGSGKSTRFLKDLGAKEVTGIDISPDLIKLAKESDEKDKTGIKYYCADCSKDLSGLNLGRFDVVSAVLLLHYSENEEMISAFLRNVKLLLKNGGRFIGQNVSPYIDPLNFNDNLKTIGKEWKLPENKTKYKNGEATTTIYLNSNTTSKDEIVIVGRFWDEEFYSRAFSKVGMKLRWVAFNENDIEDANYKMYFRYYLKTPDLVQFEAYNN